MIITSVIYPFHTICSKCDPMKVTVTPEGSSWKLLVICGPVQFRCNACNLGHTERYNSLSYCCLTLHNISAPLMNLMVWWPWNISPSMPPFLLPHTQKGNRKNNNEKQQTNWWIHCICLIYSTAVTVYWHHQLCISTYLKKKMKTAGQWINTQQS